MKRKIAFLLAMSMSCINLTALATDEEVTPIIPVKTLVFYNDLQDMVLNDNQTIKSNDLALEVIKNPPGVKEASAALWSASSGLTSLMNSISSSLFTVDPMENPELYMSLTAGYTSLQMSKSEIDSQMMSLNPKTEDEMEDTIKQFDSIKQQLVWGAQSLYMAYLNIGLSVDELIISKNSLQSTVTSLESRYEIGQISQLDLLNAQIGLSTLTNALSTLEYEQEKLLYDLNVLLGRSYDTDIKISKVLSYDVDFLSKVDFEEDFKLVLENNYNYYSLTESAKSAKDTHKSINSTASQNNYDMALLNLANEEQSMRVSFTKIYNSIDDKVRLLNFEQLLLENKLVNLNAVKLRFDLGLVSQDVLDSSQSEYDTQQIKVETAKYNLFIATEQYNWAKNGMITG